MKKKRSYLIFDLLVIIIVTVSFSYGYTMTESIYFGTLIGLLFGLISTLGIAVMVIIGEKILSKFQTLEHR